MVQEEDSMSQQSLVDLCGTVPRGTCECQRCLFSYQIHNIFLCILASNYEKWKCR